MRKIPFEQWALIIVAVIYLLESIFVRGLFSNILVFGMTLIIGIVVTVVAIFKKRYKWAIIDMVICLLCFGLVCYLYSL